MTKWQKDYLDVAADDYLTSEDYICSMGLPLNYRPKLYDLIGPHENRKMNLMRIGRKPVTLLYDWELRYWEEEIVFRGWIKNKFDYLPYWRNAVVESFLICLPGQEWRVSRLRRCFETIETGPWSPTNEARVGFLLGYTKQCIRAYLERGLL